ncbi:hypothetical protein GCM10010174_61840 [Kutzneria viridogrisea]
MAMRVTASGVWIALTVLVSVAWAANFVAPWLVSTYKPDPSINNLFMIIVGGVVTVAVERAEARHRDDRSKEETPS